MPASYTHFLVAREGLKHLSLPLKNIAKQHSTLYFFGAQGADFCFFQPNFGEKMPNLGSFLHREGGFSAFEILKHYSLTDRKTLSYALGYLSHYATDSTFHPYVYATAGESTLRHTRLEHVLDVRFRKQYGKETEDEDFLKKLSREEKDLLHFLYTRIAVKNGLTSPKKTSFYRAISLFNAYLSIPNTLFDGASKKFRAYIANEEKRTWHFPADNAIASKDDAEDLLIKSIRLFLVLSERFFEAVKADTPLPKSLFGKGFLTGI